MNSHVHWHRLMAEKDRNLYYECRCGSRRHGLKPTGNHSPIDRNWLAGGTWTGEPPKPYVGRKP